MNGYIEFRVEVEGKQPCYHVPDVDFAPGWPELRASEVVSSHRSSSHHHLNKQDGVRSEEPRQPLLPLRLNRITPTLDNEPRERTATTLVGRIDPSPTPIGRRIGIRRRTRLSNRPSCSATHGRSNPQRRHVPLPLDRVWDRNGFDTSSPKLLPPRLSPIPPLFAYVLLCPGFLDRSLLR